MELIYRIHAVQRMFERDISEDEIEYVIAHGEVISYYPEDKPYVSFLSLAILDDRALHVLYAKDENEKIIVITMYEPNPALWSDDLKTKRGL